MAGITLVIAEEQLAAWIAASTEVATAGQSRLIDYSGRRYDLRQADAAEIRQQIQFWDSKVNALTAAESGGRRRVRYVVPE